MLNEPMDDVTRLRTEVYDLEQSCRRLEKELAELRRERDEFKYRLETWNDTHAEGALRARKVDRDDLQRLLSDFGPAVNADEALESFRAAVKGEAQPASPAPEEK